MLEGMRLCQMQNIMLCTFMSNQHAWQPEGAFPGGELAAFPIPDVVEARININIFRNKTFTI